MPLGTQLVAYDAILNEDLKDLVSIMMDEDNDVIGQMFFKMGQAVENTKYEWVEKNMKSYRSYLTAAISNSATTLPIHDGAGKFIVNNLTYVTIGAETMLVTAGAESNSLTVTRGTLGTTAVAHTAGEEIFFFELETEGADASRDDSELGTKTYNYTEIFRKELDMSGTSQAVRGPGNDHKWAAQIEQQTRAILQKIRSQFVNSSVRYLSGNGKQRIMGGLPYFLQGIKKDVNGAPITEQMIETSIVNCLEGGADVNRLVMLVGTKQSSAINRFKVERVRGGGMSQSETKINNNVDEYQFINANVKIVRVPEMPNNRFFLGPQDKAGVFPLLNRGLKVEDLGKTGDGTKKLLVGEYGCEVMNGDKAWAFVDNLAIPSL